MMSAGADPYHPCVSVCIRGLIPSALTGRIVVAWFDPMNRVTTSHGYAGTAA